jgi:hypothetical protein
MTFFSSPIFYILIGLIAGTLLGKADTLFTNSRKNRKETDKIKGLEDHVKSLQEQLASSPPTTSAPAASDLRLWNAASGTPNLELDGARIGAPASLTPEQRRRLIILLTQIRPWLEGGPVAAASTQAIPAPRPVPEIRPVPATILPVKIAEPPTTPVAKSIVGQINDVLQARIAGTSLAAKLVRLGETPGGGVLVFVGTARYEGIDAVPDPEVVAAIRAAIAEWEKKAG